MTMFKTDPQAAKILSSRASSLIAFAHAPPQEADRRGVDHDLSFITSPSILNAHLIHLTKVPEADSLKRIVPVPY